MQTFLLPPICPSSFPHAPDMQACVFLTQPIPSPSPSSTDWLWQDRCLLLPHHRLNADCQLPAPSQGVSQGHPVCPYPRPYSRADLPGEIWGEREGDQRVLWSVRHVARCLCMPWSTLHSVSDPLQKQLLTTSYPLLHRFTTRLVSSVSRPASSPWSSTAVPRWSTS